jgi:hypothetical protein
LSKPAAPKMFFTAIVVVTVVAAAALIATAPAKFKRLSHTEVSTAAAKSPAVTPAEHARINAAYAALPLAFEANQGQVDPEVKYMARGNGYKLFLTDSDAVFSFHSKSSNDEPATHGRVFQLRARTVPNSRRSQKDLFSVVRMQLLHGNSHAQVAAAGELPGKTNYYLGNDPKNWHTNVPLYARVSYKSVYPGIDLAYYGERSKLEFDFIVAPESNPAPIDLSFGGAQHVATDPAGNLIVSSTAGNVVLHKPVAYQEQNGARQLVDASFVLRAKNQVTFELGNYDHSRELVIDPSVTYATYLGGSAEDDGYGIAFDSSGDTYITGQTASTDFPTAGGTSANSGGFDVFVTKISPTGSSLIYSTYVGGSGNDSGNALAVDASGDVFVAGGTSSSNFPTTAGVFQKNFGGGSSLNAFVFELNPLGSTLTFSTYLGGANDSAAASGIAIDGTGVYVVGSTASTTFPLQGPIQSSLAGGSNGFVTKFNSSGTALLYSTYLGGGTGDFASAVAVVSGQAYVTGGAENPNFPTTHDGFQKTCGSDGTCNGGLYDAFVTVYNSAGSSYVYSTFLGGSSVDEGLGIAVTSAGNAYVTGMTQSTDFPLQSASQKTLGGTQNAFVSQLNPAGSALVYSTYLGGNQTDWGTSVALDSSQNAYVTGQTSSSNFPTVNPTQATIGGGNDAFVSELNSAGATVFSTYLGGSANENTSTSGDSALGAIAVDSAGNVYVTGNTISTDFPIVQAEQKSYAGNIDAFVAKYSFPASFTISATAPATVAPGSSGTSTVTLTATNGYASPVNLTCSVSGTGSPAPTCSFSPTSVTPTGSGTTSTLTIATTGSSAAISRPSNFLYAMWLPVAGFSLMGMGFSSARSRRKKLLGFLMIAMVMTALFLMPACGGGSSNSGGGGGGGCTGCTPASTYTVTITGTGTDANQTTQSTTVTLTVS